MTLVSFCLGRPTSDTTSMARTITPTVGATKMRSADAPVSLLVLAVFDTKCGRPGVDFNNATALDSTDSWRLDGFNGTYSAFIFAAEAQRVIRAHADTYAEPDPTKAGGVTVNKPLYLYVAMQNVHGPIEVPIRFESLYDGVIADPHRKTFAERVWRCDVCVSHVESR